MGQVRTSTCPRTATDPILDCRPVPDRPEPDQAGLRARAGADGLSGLNVLITSRVLLPLIRVPLLGHAIHLVRIVATPRDSNQ